MAEVAGVEAVDQAEVVGAEEDGDQVLVLGASHHLVPALGVSHRLVPALGVSHHLVPVLGVGDLAVQVPHGANHHRRARAQVIHITRGLQAQRQDPVIRLHRPGYLGLDLLGPVIRLRRPGYLGLDRLGPVILLRRPGYLGLDHQTLVIHHLHQACLEHQNQPTLRLQACPGEGHQNPSIHHRRDCQEVRQNHITQHGMDILDPQYLAIRRLLGQEIHIPTLHLTHIILLTTQVQVITNLLTAHRIIQVIRIIRVIRIILAILIIAIILAIVALAIYTIIIHQATFTYKSTEIREVDTVIY